MFWYGTRCLDIMRTTTVWIWRHTILIVRATALRALSISILIAALMLSGGQAGLSALGLSLDVAVAHAQSLGGGTPNHFDPKSGTTSILHRLPASKLPTFKPQTQRPVMAKAFQPSMQPGLLRLDPAKATRFLGSDGRLEIDVPAGAVTANDVTASGGTLALRVTEIAAASGSSAGGSGVVSLGTYLVELVDGHGNHIGHGLRANATLKLHYGSRGSALDLDRAFVVFNGVHPQYVTSLGAFFKPAYHT
jgi:hypothetical protein